MLRIIFFLIIATFLFANNSFANDEYFLTLRYDKVNLRQGPSKEYPVKIFYKKKYLPVLIQDRSDNFRKIKDHENNTGWIHISQLSKKKAAIVINGEAIMFNNSTIYSKPLVILEIGRLCLVKRCKNNWCKVKTGEYKGWVKKDKLWGLL
tara:strand:- start:132 stop:581 length:450 start_codon:yes stop_codon:yes gene_type:complete